MHDILPDLLCCQSIRIQSTRCCGRRELADSRKLDKQRVLLKEVIRPLTDLCFSNPSRPRASRARLISTFCLGCSKPLPLRLLAAGVSSSPHPRRNPLSSLKLPFTRNPITTMTSRLPSRRLSNTLDPKSRMEDPGSELFHYTAGRFL